MDRIQQLQCDFVKQMQSEIERGKNINCICCINGSDIPEETLCRCCWRIWVGNKMFLLWDFEVTEKRIAKCQGKGEAT